MMPAGRRNDKRLGVETEAFDTAVVEHGKERHNMMNDSNTSQQPVPAQNAMVYPSPTSDNLACVPDALTQRPQWILWRGVEHVDEDTGEIRLNKIPIDPQTLHKASTTEPATWGMFAFCVSALPVALEEWEQAHPAAYRGGGLGFVFTAEDPYTGIDLDHCVDPVTGQIEAWAQGHVEALNSYTEVTPSGTGLHIIVEGTLPPTGRKKGPVEMYSYARFFTMTGWHLPDTPPTTHARQEALSALHLSVFGPPQTPRAAVEHVEGTLEDTALLTKAQAAKNGAKFTRLWDGDTSLHHGDDSSADLALCCMLAFWTQDPAQMDRLFRQSGLMRKKWDSKRGDSTYGARTIDEALARQTEHYRQDLHQSRNGDTPGLEQDPPLPYSDYTNALAFVRDHGQDLRYCYPWNAWLVWTGTHWQRDTSGEVMRRAKQTVKRLARQAECLDDKAAHALLAHVKSSLSTSKLKALIENAQSEPGIAVQPDQLDTDPWLLNCTNGTLDLKTGERRDHQQKDLMTKCLPTDYTPDAVCPTWKAFLWRIMGGSQGEDSPDMSAGELEQRRLAAARATELMAYLQRTAGYTLTGSTREQCLFLCHGPTKTGKSTYLATLRALLGPYGKQADMQTFLHKDRPEVRNDLADLAGTRYVYAVESQEGKRLAEGLVKQMTGGVDAMKARFLFEEFFEFRPQFKAYLGTNHLPNIKDSDDAIWERIRHIPFTVQIPKAERNKDLEAELLKELGGILAWAVQGCLAWQEAKDLKEPQAVIDSTQDYRAEMDTVARFLAECCQFHELFRIKAGDLHAAFVTWAEGSDVPTMTLKEMGKRLDDKKIEKKTSNFVWRLGLTLKDK